MSRFMMDFLKNLSPNKGSQSSKNTAPLKKADDETMISSSATLIHDQTLKPNSPTHYEPLQLIAACGQSIGRKRELNEDSLFTLSANLAGNSGMQPFGLYIIADGMGGHQSGEVASNTAVRCIASHVVGRLFSPLFGHPQHTIDESIQEVLQSAFDEAQKSIQREAPGSGTTLTAALILGQQVTIAHVGDSRGYILYAPEKMETVTRDHSYVRRLEELGQITAAEAATHPQRNVLYRAVGQGDSLEVDILTTAFPIGARLLLCSDGLWGLVSDEEIQRIVSEAPTIQDACQTLVSAANNGGGHDNISAIIARLLG